MRFWLAYGALSALGLLACYCVICFIQAMRRCDQCREEREA